MITRYKVSLFVLPQRSAWVTPTGPTPTSVPGFTVDARNIDNAMEQARQRVVGRGLRVRSVNASGEKTVVVYAEETSCLK